MYIWCSTAGHLKSFKKILQTSTCFNNGAKGPETGPLAPFQERVMSMSLQIYMYPVFILLEVGWNYVQPVFILFEVGWNDIQTNIIVHLLRHSIGWKTV